MRSRRNRLSWVLILLALLLLSAGCEPTHPVDLLTPTGDLSIHFIDVGQGDAILLQFPSGQNMLIDAGSNASASTVIDYLHQQGVQKLDYCVGTHPHEDHIGALDDVIQAFPVGHVYLPKVAHTTRTFENLLEAISQKGLKIRQAKAGVNIDVGSQATATIVAPIGGDYQDLNDYSVVIQVTYDETAALFTGDADKVSEQEIVQSGGELEVDLLKVAHHASRTSSSQELLNITNPTYAVITVGPGNMYGHPHSEVIDRLTKLGSRIYRTDLAGSIVFRSDGQTLACEQTPPDTNSDLELAVDRRAEVATVTNTGEQTIDLTKWILISEIGDQRYSFPRSTILKPGATLQVASGPNAKAGPKRLVWTTDYLWNNSYDPAALYSSQGTLVKRVK